MVHLYTPPFSLTIKHHIKHTSTNRYILTLIITNYLVTIIILYETPFILSYFPWTAASNKISMVFSKEASILILTLINTVDYL